MTSREIYFFSTLTSPMKVPCFHGYFGRKRFQLHKRDFSGKVIRTFGTPGSSSFQSETNERLNGDAALMISDRCSRVCGIIKLPINRVSSVNDCY